MSKPSGISETDLESLMEAAGLGSIRPQDLIGRKFFYSITLDENMEEKTWYEVGEQYLG